MANFNDAVFSSLERLSERKIRYMIMNLDASNTWQLVYESARSESHTDLLTYLNENSCCFVCYDMPHNQKGPNGSAIVTIAWSPEGAGVRPRIRMASATQNFWKELPIVVRQRFNIETLDELSLESLQSQLTFPSF
jgi:Cofilin/tropomyosin-type actin-binding protein